MITSSRLENFVIVFALISSLLTIVPQPPAEAAPVPCVSTGMIAKWDFKQMHLDNPSYTNYGNSSCGGVNLVESSDGVANTLTSEGLVFGGDKWLGTSSVPASLIGDRSYTISTWMKNPLGGIVSWGSFTEPEAECGNGNHLQTFYDHATNQWGIANYWWACDIQYRESYFGITRDDIFHNLVVTYNSATDFRTIYLDGIQLVSEPVETAPNFLGNALRIGSTPGTVPTLTGTMRNLSIYNRALEASEVSEDFCAESVCDLVLTRGSDGTERKTAFTTQPEVTIKDLRNNTVTSSSAVVTATVSSGGTLVGTSTATASSGVATFTNLGLDGTIGTEYTITYTAVGLTSTSATVTPTGTTCDGTSFTCQVSDTGPGGGKVFYVASEFFTQLGATGSMCTTRCKYLEAAPTTGSTNWTDSDYAWSGNINTEVGASAKGTAIGSGYQNTLAIVGQDSGGNTAERAGTNSQAYRGPNNKTDWFLPSQDELHQLRLQKTIVSANVGHANYWSSTEINALQARYLYFLDVTNFVSEHSKSLASGIAVRPIRAFGPVTYEITLAAGTSGSGSNQTLTKTNGVSLTLPDSATANGYFTRAGYSVTGWSTTDLGSQTHTLGGAFTTEAITTLYAQWTPVAPAFTLSASSGSTTTGSAISSYSISSTGGAVASYSISPAISNGTLSFSTSTGLLSGTPSTAAGATTYTITATNVSGSATQSFILTIESSAPVVVYVPPTPVPFLKTLTAPQMHLAGGKLVCTAGTYQTGQTLDGVVQTSATALFTPTNYVFNLLINGQAQSALTKTISSNSVQWDLSIAPSTSTVSCSVTVTANSLTNTEKSTSNTTGLGAASATLAQATTDANNAYSAAQSANSTTYQKALVDNRALWRKQVENIRANYYETLARITASSAGRKMITDKSTALKVMVAAQKKSAADYKASGPAALATKDAANKVALDAKNVAIAAANATYGTFIESIGYGVLIP